MTDITNINTPLARLKREYEEKLALQERLIADLTLRVSNFNRERADRELLDFALKALDDSLERFGSIVVQSREKIEAVRKELAHYSRPSQSS